MNMDLIKNEATGILLSHGNKTWYHGALGKPEYNKIIEAQKRVNFLYGAIRNMENPASIEVKTIKHGYLYNYYAMNKICTDKAHVPSMAEWNMLIDYLGGYEVAAGKLKNTTTWNAPNTGATNEVGFNANASGANVLNSYGMLGENAQFATSTLSGDFWSCVSLSYNYASTAPINNYKKNGVSVRLIVDTPEDVQGDKAVYVGNDGQRYNCIKIGNQWWMSENLIETKYNDNTPIASDFTATEGACGYYNNILSNAYTSVFTNGDTVFIGLTEIDGEYSKYIETLRHYKGLVYDLSSIGSESTPSPTPSAVADHWRAGSANVNIGANIIAFTSALPSTDYTINAWVRGTKNDILYGYLYNYYAVTDNRNIAPSGWHVPTQAEFSTLKNYLGGELVSGGKLKETGTVYWATSIGATNESGFNGRGGGYRKGTDGSFANIANMGYFMTSTPNGASDYQMFYLSHNTTSFVNSASLSNKHGRSLRLIKDDSNNTGTVQGNDGRTYKTVKIGDQVWMAENSAETKYRNGDTIPTVTGSSDWIALTTGAKCAYNNDGSLVAEDGTEDSGESQYDLGVITKTTGGFTVSDVILKGKLYYQAILNQ